MFWASSLCSSRCSSNLSSLGFCTLGLWPTGVATMGSLPSGLLSCLANGRHHGESRRQESQVGVCIPLASSLPGGHGCLSGYLQRLSPLTPAGSPMGGKGSLLLLSRVSPHPWLCFLNPTRTFVNIPFILFASIYPVRVCHLFPARSLTNRMSSSL